MHILVIVIFCIIYKTIINANYWYRLSRYQKLHQEYLDAVSEKSSKVSVLWQRLTEEKSEIVTLFKNAGLQDFTMTVNQPIGFGYAQPQRFDIFNNLTSLSIIGGTNIPAIILNYFVQGVGIYKMRFKESFSIFYWVNVLIFLPQKIIMYLGFSLDGEKTKLIAKVFNFVYWLFLIGVGVIFPLLHLHIILLHTP